MFNAFAIYRLVDDITVRAATKAGKPSTSTAILGPFWRADAPVRENGTTITFDTPSDGQVAFMHGQVTCAETGKPLANAKVDVWQASTNGTLPRRTNTFNVNTDSLFFFKKVFTNSKMRSRLITTSVASSSQTPRETTHSTVCAQHRIRYPWMALLASS